MGALVFPILESAGALQESQSTALYGFHVNGTLSLLAQKAAPHVVH